MAREVRAYTKVCSEPTFIDTKIKYDLDDWFPKLHEGGLFAGKDYCASKGEKSDSPERFGQRPW